MKRVIGSWNDSECFIDVCILTLISTSNLMRLDISYKHFKALLKTYMFRQGHGTL